MLILADAAGIDRRDLGSRWTTLLPTATSAGGVPLALLLAGRTAVTTRTARAIETSRAAGGAGDPIGEAIDMAIAELPIDVVRSIATLAHLPDGSSIEFACRLLGAEQRDVRYRIEGLDRRGLVVLGERMMNLRVGVLEPVRQHLLQQRSELAPTGSAAARRAVLELGIESFGDSIELFNREKVGLLDDEHLNVRAVLAQSEMSAVDRAVLAGYIAPCWSFSGRGSEARTLVEEAARVEAISGEEIGDADRSRILLSLASASCEFAERAVHLDALQRALPLAQRAGDHSLEIRITGELAIGLGWLGDVDGAEAMIVRVDELRRAHAPEADITSLRMLQALLVGRRGEFHRSAQMLVDEADAQEQRRPERSMTCLALASTMLMVAGDDTASLNVLHRARAFDLDRFTATAHAKIAFDLAQLSRRYPSPATATDLRCAASTLEAVGDRRRSLICKRELASWLLDESRDTEAVELLLQLIPVLLEVDRRATAPALARLACAPKVPEAARAILARAALDLAGGDSGPSLHPAEQTEVDKAADLAGASSVDDETLLSAVRDLDRR